MCSSRSYVFNQPDDGFRSPFDGIVLVDFVRQPVRHAVDLGAGSGRITLELLSRELAHHVTAVECSSVAVDYLRRNVCANAWSDRTHVEHNDVEQASFRLSGTAQLVLSNPPFFEPRSGPASPRTELARARHGDESTLVRFVRSARRCLGRRGSLCMVWPSDRLVPMLTTLSQVGLHPRRLQFVYTAPDRPARRVLVEASPGRPGGLTIEPPRTWYSPYRQPARK